MWAMAMGLAWVLQASRMLAGFDGGVRKWFVGLEAGMEMREVPTGVVAGVMAAWVFGIVWVILESPGTWRRMVLWVTALVLTVAMVPVLVLGGWWLLPGMPVVAVIWSGVCAMVYAGRHRMPCEGG